MSSHTEVQERAMRAQQAARKILATSWAPFVRMVSRKPKMKVVLTGGSPRTDGTTTWLRVPIELGDDTPHNKALCGQRDPKTAIMRCEACNVFDRAQFTIFHESSHIVNGSFEAISEHDLTTILLDALKLEAAGRDDTKRAAKLAAKVEREIKFVTSYIGAANIVSPFLPMLLNAVEDVYVNAAMISARPGIAEMAKAAMNDTFINGNKGMDGTISKWSDAPLNVQAVIGILCKGTADFEMEDYLDPKVIADLEDPELTHLVAEITFCQTARTRYRLAIKLLEALRRLGYLLSPDDPEDDPEPKGDDGESESETEGESDEKDSSDEEEPAAGEGEGDDSDSADDSGEESGDGSGSDAEGDDADDEGDDDEASDGNGGGSDADDDDEADGEGDDDEASDGNGGGSDVMGDDRKTESTGAESDPKGSDEGEAGADDDTFGDEGDAGGSSEAGETEGDPGEGHEGGNPLDDLDMGGGPSLPSGDPEETEQMFKAFGGHEHDDEEDDLSYEEQEEREEVERAVQQGEHFDKPSTRQGGLIVVKPDEGRAFARGDGHVAMVGPAILGPALQKARITFTLNKKGKRERNLESGQRLDGRVLATRFSTGDKRLFESRTRPGKRNYFVVIGLDVSGSTNRWMEDGTRLIDMIKMAAYAQAELLARLGVKFAIYAHTGDQADVLIHEVKGPDEPWGVKQQQQLGRLGPYAANLDGHTMEFYRKVLDRRTETDRIILYYTDGAMPLENYEEELEVLQENIEICRRRGYHLLGVGCLTDSPTRHGLETVRLDGPEDVPKVVEELRKKLT